MRKNLLILFLFSFLVSVFCANAFDFYGYAYNITKGALDNTNITIKAYVFDGGPPQEVYSNSTLSNASGWFNLSNIPDNESWMYQPIVRHYSGADADYVGQSLPAFPFFEMQNLGEINFYLREGATLNLTAINESGGAVPFNYQIKDTRLGYPIAENFNNMVSQATVYVPADRNYSIMIYPNESFPISYDLNNLSAYSAPKHVDIIFNTSSTLRRVSGYAFYNGAAGFTELNSIAYLLEPGDMIFQDFPLPYNMSAWNSPPESDYYNATSGFFNITLPGAAMGAEIMLFVTAWNNSDCYGAFRNITLGYDSSPIVDFNFSLQPLLGDETDIEFENAVGGYINVTTCMVWFQLKNSSGSNISDFAFVETGVDYTSLYNGTIPFSWAEDVEQSDNGLFSLILLENSGVDEMNIFTPSAAPMKTSFTSSELSSGTVQITLSSFNPGAIDPADDFIDLFIDLLMSSDECDVPNPSLNCSLIPAEVNESVFNPLSVIIGGGKISFRMRKNSNNITVHYANVDLLASGPPDVFFDPDANESTDATILEEAWRFGSLGPEIYDFVLVGIPYDGSIVDENAPITVTIENLYDNDWNVVWDVDVNGTNVTLPEYSDFDSSWFIGVTCNKTGVPSGNQWCYANATTDMIWLKIPHFSGIGPSVNTITKGNVTIATESTTVACMPNCSFEINLTNMNYTVAQSLQNITINTTKLSGLGSLDYVKIYWWNITTGNWSYLNENSTEQIDYNLTFYNSSNVNTTHRYRFVVNKTSNRGVLMSVNYNISSLAEILGLNFSLTCTEDWSCSDWSSCVNGQQTRNCTDANDCGTTNDRPSLSQSCSTGGGGGSTITKTTIGAEATTVTLDMTDKAVFTVGGERHYAQIKKIYENHVTITVRSPAGKDVDLYINKTEKVDVNDDNVYDLEMTLLEIGKKTAKILFRVIEEAYAYGEEIPVEEEVIEEEVIEEEVIEEEVEAVSLEEEKEKMKEGWVMVILIVVLVVLLAAVVIVLVRKGRRKRRHHFF